MKTSAVLLAALWLVALAGSSSVSVVSQEQTKDVLAVTDMVGPAEPGQAPVLQPVLDGPAFPEEWNMPIVSTSFPQAPYTVGVCVRDDELWMSSGGGSAYNAVISVYNLANPLHPLIARFDQPIGTTGWGIRDMAYSPAYDEVYGGGPSSYQLEVIDGATHTLKASPTIPSPAPTLLRVMARDDKDSLYTGGGLGNVVKFNRVAPHNPWNFHLWTNMPSGHYGYGAAVDLANGYFWFYNETTGDAEKLVRYDFPSMTNQQKYPVTGATIYGGGCEMYGSDFLILLDQNSPDDIIRCLRVKTLPHDVGMTDIERPTFFGEMPESFQPRAEIKNWGVNPENNFGVRCQIFDKSSNLVYNNTITITVQLDPGTARWLDFPAWTNPPQDDDYEAVFTSLLVDDNPANDEIARTFLVNATLECYWDGIDPAAPFNGIRWNFTGRGWLHGFPNYWGSIQITKTRVGFHPLSGVIGTYQVEVRDNSGTGGAPGATALYNSGSQAAPLGVWLDHTLPTPLTYSGPRFYIGYVQVGYGAAAPYIDFAATKTSPSYGLWAEFPAGTFIQDPDYLPTGDLGLRCFITKTPPPPEDFNLTLPVDEAPDQPVTGIVFEWEDANPPDAVVYEVWLAVKGQTLVKVKDGLTSPTWTYDLADLEYGTTYEWNVKALNGPQEKWSQNGPFEFTTIVAPPEDFNLMLPVDEAPNQPVTGIVFEWEDANPPDAVAYEVWLAVKGQALVKVKDGLTSPTWTYDLVDPLEYLMTYEWNVKAFNGPLEKWSQNGPYEFTTMEAGGIFHDVGVTAVLRPPSVVGLGLDVYPRMTVENFGDVTEGPFDVRCIITEDGNPTPVFDEVEQVLSLASHTSVDFEFETYYWTATSVGDFNVLCQTELAGDMVPGNDANDHDFTVVTTLHDVGVASVLRPVGTVRENTTVFPKMTVRNYGTETEGPFDVRCIITEDGNPTPVFDYAEEIASLPSGGAPVDFEFTVNSWLATPQGDFHVRCTTELTGDMENSNDWCELDFEVGPAWAESWVEVRSMPALPSSKPVKNGGWLAKGPDRETDAEVIYAAKGYKTADFFKYYPFEDTWHTLKEIPAMEEGRVKLPYKGSRGVTDNLGAVYMVKGNNTLGFWRYDIQEDTWTALPGVPPGNYRKKVKGGTDMAYVQKGDTGWVYLLKGYKTEFYRYNVQSQQWYTLDEVPYGYNKAKYDKGSFLVYDDGNFIYAHQAKYYDKAVTNPRHFMFRYDLAGDTWYKVAKKGMPIFGLENGRENKKKKSKDGAAGAWYNNSIYALKGGNTQGFFKYFPTPDSWTQLETVPGNGSYGRKKRVKYGADIERWGGGAFFALKGNKTYECWRYVEGATACGLLPTAGRSGIMAGRTAGGDCRLSISPNPIASGFAVLRYSLPKAGPVSLTVFDVAGRSVLRTAYSVGRKASSVSLDLRKLSSGVYLVRLDAEGLTQTQKLVVQR